MKLSRNRIIIILWIISILLTLSICKNFYKIKNIAKYEVKNFLGFLGIKKYKRIKLHSQNFAIFFKLQNSYKIFPILKTKKIEFYKLDNDKLIFKPGYYKFGNCLYNLSEEGLYYLIDFNRQESRFVIIYKSDLVSLISAFSWLISHGNKDVILTYKEKYHKIIHHKLSLTCGPASRFVSNILNELGIKNRIVNFLTLDKWNTYDNGHVLLEIERPDKSWMLVDIDNNCFFRIGKKFLCVKDFLEYNDVIDRMDLVFLSLDSPCSGDFKHGGIDYVAYCEYIHASLRHLKLWYRRVMQVPFINVKGKLYTCVANRKYRNKILQYYPTAIFLDKSVFIDRFYQCAE